MMSLEGEQKKIRVIIVDDHLIMCDAVGCYLAAQPDIAVVGLAGNGREAVKLVEEQLPDVVLMDLMMPDLNGIEATRNITSRFPDCKVLVFSGNPDRKLLRESLRAGAKGFTLKTCVSAEDLATAIRKVATDEMYFSQPVSKAIFAEYMNMQEEGKDGEISALSPREREILQLIAEGNTVKEIAFAINISYKTVNAHRQNIMKKLNLGSVAELTRFAMHEGMIE